MFMKKFPTKNCACRNVHQKPQYYHGQNVYLSLIAVKLVHKLVTKETHGKKFV